MIKLLYDHQIFAMQRYGGISRYFANLQQGLQQLPGVEVQLGVRYSKNEYIKDRFSGWPAMLGKWLSNHQLNKWNRVYSKQLILQGDFDVLHPTYYHPEWMQLCKKPIVLTVHDMIHELFPHYFPTTDAYVAHKKNSIQLADHFIAISEATKNDLQRIFQIPDEKITRVYHGYTPFVTATSEKIHSPANPYLLFVGDRKLYKNFTRFIKAMAPLLKENTDLQVICAGGGAWSAEELTLLATLEIAERVQQMNVTDAILQSLYQSAEVFVYPSEYEGFGFPILESFDARCAVVVSNTSCFAEVAGDAALYFDPYDEADIYRAVHSLLYNRQLANQLIQKGQQRLQLFSMQQCLDQTLAVYQKMIS